MTLSRKDIREIAAKDFLTEEVECPQLGGTVIVREMSALSRMEITFELLNDDGDFAMANMGKVFPRVVEECAVDDTGRPLFEPRQVHKLRGVYGEDIQNIAMTALRLSGITQEETEEDAKN